MNVCAFVHVNRDLTVFGIHMCEIRIQNDGSTLFLFETRECKTSKITSRQSIMNFGYSFILIAYWISCTLIEVLSIRCYQCSSDENKLNDTCGTYEIFDSTKNSPVDCMAEDAVTPGTFCYKSIQQGPRGFVWDGRWRTVIRRCAQISERGISWGCDWGFHENGVYWEECYCAEDGCNGSTSVLDASPYRQSFVLIASIISSIIMTINLTVRNTCLVVRDTSHKQH